MKRRPIFVATCALAWMAVPSATHAGGHPPAANPFVGSWESIDPAPDSSHVRLQIGATGNYHLRDEQGSVCLNNELGFVPATVQGTGEFLSADTYETDGGDIYCYPRDGRGREFVLTVPGTGYAYWPQTDIMIDQYGVCWWRSGTGDPSDCPAD